MTGEITLTGQVLPIGGVREKVLAAQRAGLKRIDPPARERARPRRSCRAETRKELEFVLVDSIEDVFAVAFDGTPPARARGPRRPRSARPPPLFSAKRAQGRESPL